MSDHSHEQPVTYATGGIITGPTIAPGSECRHRCCERYAPVVVKIDASPVSEEVGRAISERLMELMRRQAL